MVIDVGYNFAKKWSDAHENGASNQPDIEKRMDLYNNAVGLKLGRDNPATTLHSTFVKNSKQKVSGGYCRINKNGILVKSNSEGAK